jgi:hypothetical protein
MELLEVLITLLQTVTVPAGATGTVSVYQQLLILLKSNETFTIVSGTASATGTINDNDAATVQRSSAATEGSPAVFEFSLSNPSAEDTTYTFTFTNGTAGSADYTTTSQTTVPAGATTGECTNNCRYD